ncbi:MAG TPA: 30S ribosomal protein S9 [Gemmataceae bacterium]|nr:30S ribosomal protein S9 [Gemmataceae bacterium]
MADPKTKKTYYLGTGRRKTSVARVRLSEGNGQIIINGRGLDEYFTEEKDRSSVTGPLNLTEMRNRLDVSVKVEGGGITGQAGAVTQGLARALKEMFGLTTSQQEAADGTDVVSSMAKKLRDSHFLTRDSRMKERKKYGRKGARKSFQFSKR